MGMPTPGHMMGHQMMPSPQMMNQQVMGQQMMAPPAPVYNWHYQSQLDHVIAQEQQQQAERARIKAVQQKCQDDLEEQRIGMARLAGLQNLKMFSPP